MMAHLDIKTTYAVQLTPGEFRLVGLALVGKLKGAEMKDAAELNARLQENCLHCGRSGSVRIDPDEIEF